MTLKTIAVSLNETDFKPAKNNYSTNKTDVYHIDDTWSLDILYYKDYASENKRYYGYVLVETDNFIKFARIVTSKIENAQTIKHSLENILTTSKRKPIVSETDRGEDLYNSIFQNFLINKNIKQYSRNTSFGAAFWKKN